MHRLTKLKPGVAAVFYIVLDVACVALSMRLPVLCILLGGLVGWYVARREMRSATSFHQILSRGTRLALFTSAFTMLLMLVAWGPAAIKLFGPETGLESMAIPLSLSSRRAEVATWLVLMILISPFLQLLMTILGLHLTLLRRFAIYGAALKRMDDPS